MDSDWIKQELKRTGKSQAGLAEVLRLNPSQVTRLLSGNRRLKADEIPKVSQYLGSEAPGPLHTPQPFDSSGFPRDVPIREGALCGEDGAFEFDSQTADFAPRPPRLAGVKDAYALYVRGESMSPWREQGQIVYVHPGMPVRNNDYVVLQLKPKTSGDTPAAYIKRLVGQNAREIKLLQFNPQKYLPFARINIRAIHRVMELEELLSI